MAYDWFLALAFLHGEKNVSISIKKIEVIREKVNTRDRK